MATTTAISNTGLSWDGFELALPHPYLTFYRINKSSSNQYQLQYARGETSSLPSELHNDKITFTELEKGEEIPPRTNTQYFRARASQSMKIQWKGDDCPSIAQIWVIFYAVFSVSSDQEQFRLLLKGAKADLLIHDLRAVGLAIAHPSSTTPDAKPVNPNEVLVQRHQFWQGAGSPFGPRPVWVPSTPALQTTSTPLSNFPLLPLSNTITTGFPSQPIHTLHPLRPSKPTPGSLIYSRYIPHLKSHFSMLALNHQDPSHLELFHNWQNDPRVAAGWNETGTLEQHFTYLDNLHKDPHTLTVLARFGDSPFAYFEIYWGKEDTLGAHCKAGEWDRGRHSLVGDIGFRGPHRVTAWWSSLVHYMFLDSPLTQNVIGEPKATNERVLMYDFLNGFAVERWVDFPHKRSAFVRVGRERFFSLFGLDWRCGVEKMVIEADARYRAAGGSKL